MNKKSEDRRGIALVMTLWLLVMLVVLASQFAVNARSGLETVRNFKEDREAYFLALAGVQMAMKEIMADSQYHYYGGEGQLRFARTVDESADIGYSSRADVPLGAGLASYSIRDLNSKLDLNNVAADEGLLRRLLQNLFPEGLDGIDTVVDSIQDWVDPDDDTRVNGAESGYYRTLNPPYSAKNWGFDTLNELKKINGVTKGIYDALIRLVTVHPVTGVNVNTAPPEVLIASGLPEDEVLRILDARDSQGYYSNTTRSDIFEITSTGFLGENALIHSIKAVVRQVERRKLVVLDWVDDYYTLDLPGGAGALKEKSRSE